MIPLLFVLSCALAEKDKLVAEWTVQKRLTHSEQLIPHMDEILKDAGVDQKEITAIAAAKATGVVYRSPYRTCYRKDSSLYMGSSAYRRRYPGSAGMESGWRELFILPLLDAQRGNVYAAMYGSFDEIWQEAPAEAASIDEVVKAAASHGGPILAVGEGAEMYREKLLAEGIQVAPPHNCCARASSVAMAAFVRWEKGQIDDPLQLMPNYIRRSEAEVLWEKLHGMN